MAITYPFTVPASPTFSEMTYKPITLVGVTRSPFTLQTQTFVWPGQAWAFRGVLPPISSDAEADAWITWKLALNGQQGTFLIGPSTRKTTRGSAAGAKTVDTGAVFNSTTLPITGGTGAFVAGDWLQISNTLYRVLQNNGASVDVWPRLRSSYAAGTAITYVNPKGTFRLASNDMDWTVNLAKHTGLVVEAVEAL